jgi:hypothetical protein
VTWPSGPPASPSPASPPPAGPPPAVRRPGAGAGAAGGIGRARIREAPPYELAAYGTAPVETVSPPAEPAARTAEREPWYQVVTGLPASRPAQAWPAQSRPAPAWPEQGHANALPWNQALAASGPQARGTGEIAGLGRTEYAAGLAQPALGRHAGSAQPGPSPAARLPRVAPHPVGHPPTGDGRRHCGPLEKILHRQWDVEAPLPAQVIAAIDRLAEFPRPLQEKLADNLVGIYVGPGGVPELDDMSRLRGVPLPSGRATWDACAGAYGERKIVVGSRPSPTPDVICHEVGHALDDLDAAEGKWQSDSPEFRWVYDQCKPHIVSDFHRQRGGLGRKEFFADAFAAIASGQRPALVDMLGGNTRTALRVMLYFNRRYGI